MKGIKLGLLGVCLGLAGLAAASNNVIAIGFAFVSVTAAIAGLFTKE